MIVDGDFANQTVATNSDAALTAKEAMIIKETENAVTRLFIARYNLKII